MTNYQQHRSKALFFVNYDTNTSIISEKCIDIMACVHNYFWPWQCAMTAFLRLLFLQLFSFSYKPLPSPPSFYSFVNVTPLTSATLLTTHFDPGKGFLSLHTYLPSDISFLQNPVSLHLLNCLSTFHHFHLLLSGQKANEKGRSPPPQPFIRDSGFWTLP